MYLLLVGVFWIQIHQEKAIIFFRHKYENFSKELITAAEWDRKFLGKRVFLDVLTLVKYHVNCPIGK